MQTFHIQDDDLDSPNDRSCLTFPVIRRGAGLWFGAFGSEGEGYCAARKGKYGNELEISDSLISRPKSLSDQEFSPVPYWYGYDGSTRIERAGSTQEKGPPACRSTAKGDLGG